MATGSVRRRAQLASLRPDLTFAGLRGNMATRLEKASQFDAIVVAAIALERLGWADRIAEVLAPSVLLPQVAQGALAVECRADDDATRSLLATIEHAPSRLAVDAERGFLAELGGDCDLPAGAHAVVEPDEQRYRAEQRQLLVHASASLTSRCARDGSIRGSVGLGYPPRAWRLERPGSD